MLALPAGSELAGYRIESVAGHGGMGIVYRATDIALDRAVAIKLISEEFAGDQGFRDRFKRESRLAASIRHPNVVTVFRAGEEDGRLYIATEFVEGTDLKSMLAEQGALEPRVAADIVSQVASALDAAHAKAMVHRDVKPANVLITNEGAGLHAYLTDFGLTKSTTSGSAMTETGAFVGTVDYAAPEQLHGIRVDARTDVYSLTCMLYQAVTGEVPYPRDSSVAKMYAHAQEPPPSVLAAAPDAPAELENVVKRGMAKEPDERYPSAGDLARATVAAVERRDVSASERSVAVGAAAPASVVPSVPAQRRRRAPRMALAAVVALVIGAAATLALVLGGGGGGGGDAVAPSRDAVAPSRDHYQDAVLDAFRPVTALIVAVEPKVPPRVDDPQKQVTAATELAKVRNAMDKAIATLRSIPTPADVRGLHQRLLDVLEQMRSHVANAVAAADFGNTRDYRAASRALVKDQTLLDPLAPEFRAKGYARLGQAR